MSALKRLGKQSGVRILLLKSEPYEYSIADLAKEPDSTDRWDGIRNHVAKNNLASAEIGDLCLFYHSNAKKETGIVGVAECVKTCYDDPLAKDPKSKYYDANWLKKGTQDECKWKSIDIKLLETWTSPVTLIDLKAAKEQNNERGKILSNMELFRTARLSVQKVTEQEFEEIDKMRHELDATKASGGEKEDSESTSKRQRETSASGSAKKAKK